MPEPGVLSVDAPGADPDDLVTCADCGKPVFWYPARGVVVLGSEGVDNFKTRGRWASKEHDGVRLEVFVFTCRLVREDGLLIAADYHHVAGEPQVRWRLGAGQYVEDS